MAGFPSLAYYAEEDPAEVDPLDVDGWRFYVIPTPELEAHFGAQKKVALSRISVVTEELGYKDLKTIVDAVVGQVTSPYS